MTRTQKVRAAVVAVGMAAVAVGGLGHASATSASSSAPRPTEARTIDCPTLRVGDTGQAVTELQYRLRSYGYSVAVDGVFGPVTESRVRHLQRVSGLVEDGIVGRITQKALGCGRVPAAPSAPAPRAVPTVAPSPRAVASVSGWHDLAIAAGWTEEQWPKLSCIIQRESRGQAGVINSAGATGLLQILKRYHPNDNLFDPFTNLRVGHELFLLRGWQPWHAPAGVKQC